MKEFAAGSKAKTVQLADFKWLVCPLDAQLEKLPLSYDVCGGRGQTGAIEAPNPSICWHQGSGRLSPSRAEGSTTGSTALHSAPAPGHTGHHRASGLPKASPPLTGVRGGLSAPEAVLGRSQLQQARLRGPAEAAPGTRGEKASLCHSGSPGSFPPCPPALILPPRPPGPVHTPSPPVSLPGVSLLCDPQFLASFRSGSTSPDSWRSAVSLALTGVASSLPGCPVSRRL